MNPSESQVFDYFKFKTSNGFVIDIPASFVNRTEFGMIRKRNEANFRNVQNPVIELPFKSISICKFFTPCIIQYDATEHIDFMNCLLFFEPSSKIRILYRSTNSGESELWSMEEGFSDLIDFLNESKNVNEIKVKVNGFKLMFSDIYSFLPFVIQLEITNFPKDFFLILLSWFGYSFHLDYALEKDIHLKIFERFFSSDECESLLQPLMYVCVPKIFSWTHFDQLSINSIEKLAKITIKGCVTTHFLNLSFNDVASPFVQQLLRIDPKFINILWRMKIESVNQKLINVILPHFPLIQSSSQNIPCLINFLSLCVPFSIPEQISAVLCNQISDNIKIVELLRIFVEKFHLRKYVYKHIMSLMADEAEYDIESAKYKKLVEIMAKLMYII